MPKCNEVGNAVRNLPGYCWMTRESGASPASLAQPKSISGTRIITVQQSRMENQQSQAPCYLPPSIAQEPRLVAPDHLELVDKPGGRICNSYEELKPWRAEFFESLRAKSLSVPKPHSWLCAQLLCNDSKWLQFIFLCVLEVSDTSRLGYATVLIELPQHMLKCCNSACPLCCVLLASAISPTVTVQMLHSRNHITLMLKHPL